MSVVVFVCSVSTWEKSEMLTLKTSLATYGQNHRYDHYFFHDMFGSLCEVMWKEKQGDKKQIGLHMIFTNECMPMYT